MIKNNRRLILHKKMFHIELWLELEHVFVVNPTLHCGANITLFADGLPVLWLRFLQATQICIFLGDQTQKFSVLPSAKYNLPNIVIIVCTIDLYIFPLPESVKSVQFPCNFQCWFRQLLMFTVRKIRTNPHSRTYKFGMFMFPWPSNVPLYLADFGMFHTYISLQWRTWYIVGTVGGINTDSYDSLSCLPVQISLDNELKNVHAKLWMNRHWETLNFSQNLNPYVFFCRWSCCISRCCFLN